MLDVSQNQNLYKYKSFQFDEFIKLNDSILSKYPIHPQFWKRKFVCENMSIEISRYFWDLKIYKPRDPVVLNYFKNNLSKRFLTEFWVERGYSEEEANYNAKLQKDLHIKKSGQCFRKEFWVERGYSEEEALEKISEIQRNNSKKYYEKYTKEERVIKNPVQIQYWLNLGYSEEEAKYYVKLRQTTFSKKICIEKYGKELGLKKFKERQDKWQNTLQQLPNINEINKRKDARSIEWAKRKFGNDWAAKRAEIIKRQRFKNSYQFAAINYFSPIIDYCLKNNIEIFYAENEYQIIFENKLYFYDLTIPEYNIVFEFNGHKFHPRENETKWVGLYQNISYENAYRKDQHKKLAATYNGFEYFCVFDNDQDEIKNDLLLRVMEKIKNEKD